jgi:hypothetical protein
MAYALKKGLREGRKRNHAMVRPMSGKPFHPIPLALALALYSVMIAVCGAPGLCLALAAGVISLALAGVGPAQAARDGRFLLWMALFIIPARLIDPWAKAVFDPAAIPGTLAYIARLIAVFLHAEAFYRGTGAFEAADAISASARAVTGRADIDPGMYAALAILLMPRLLVQAGASLDAARSRGYALRPARRGRAGLPRLRRGLAAARAILGSMLKRSLMEGFRRAEALEARSYTPARRLRLRPLGLRDVLQAATPAAALVVLLAIGL